MRSFGGVAQHPEAMIQTLHVLLAERALRVAGPGESFTLSTGRQSKFYFNCKPVTLSSEGMSLVADAFLDVLDSYSAYPAAVGGRTLGADPIVGGMMMRARERGRVLEGFYVRDHQKAHGTRELIANAPAAGTRVVIVDDVVTTGKSTIDAIRAARSAGCDVLGVIVLMDRLEQNGAQNIREHVMNYHAVFTRRAFPEIAEAEAWDTTGSESPCEPASRSMG